MLPFPAAARPPGTDIRERQQPGQAAREYPQIGNRHTWPRYASGNRQGEKGILIFPGFSGRPFRGAQMEMPGLPGLTQLRKSET